MTKNLLSYVLILLICFYAKAQQTPHYTQYIYNMEVINPAAVGARSDFNVSLLSRHQWININGAPTTQTLAISARTKRGLGLGTSIIHDEIGLVKSTNANIDISYTLITSQYGRLAFGLKGGMTFFSNNLNDGTTPDNDIYASITGNYPNIGFGALYYNPKYFIGFSLPYLLKMSQFIINQNATLPEIADNANYFLTAGIKHNINDNLQVRPSAIIKYNSKLPVSIDINANFLYKKYLEAGISYRYNESMSALLAFTISEKIRIGYSYDQKFANYGINLNTHEIILRMDVDLKRKGRWLLHSSCYF